MKQILKLTRLLKFKRSITLPLILLMGLQTSIYSAIVPNIDSLKKLNPVPSELVTVLGYYAPNDGGGGQFYWDANSMDSANGGTIFETSSTGNWIRLRSNFDTDGISVRWFGAVSDVVDSIDTIVSPDSIIRVALDDYYPIQNALNRDFKKVVFPTGTYKISTGISSNIPNRIITANGPVTITSDNFIRWAMVHVGPLGTNTTISNLTINGNNKCFNGMSIEGNGFRICNNTIKNLAINSYDSIGCLGIAISALGEGWVERNKIVDLYAQGTNGTGDGSGASRGISVNALSAPRTGTIIIKNNFIDSILGEEGDGIYVKAGEFDTLDLKSYESSFAIIESNSIKHCSRRGIKIQASQNVVSNNTYIHNLDTISSPKFASAIDIICGQNNTISNNHVDGTGEQGITLTGYEEASNLTSNNTIINNLIEAGSSGWDAGICIKYADENVIRGNTIEGGVFGCKIDNSNHVIVENNNIKCEYNGDITAIYVTEGSDNIIRGNSIKGGAYGCRFFNSKRTIVEGNIDLNPTYSSTHGAFIMFAHTCDTYTCQNNTGFSSNNSRRYFIYSNGKNGIISDNHVRYNGTDSFSAVFLGNLAYSTILGNASSNSIDTKTLEQTAHKLFVAGNIENKSPSNPASGWPRQTYSPSAPTQLKWNKGDICWNSDPDNGNGIGWICTDSSGSGTWVPISSLQ